MSDPRHIAQTIYPLKSPESELLSALPWSCDIAWFGDSGIHQMDGDRVARIKLEEGIRRETGREHAGLDVEIVHKIGGRIVAQHFRLSDYLIDQRTSLSGPANPRIVVAGGRARLLDVVQAARALKVESLLQLCIAIEAFINLMSLNPSPEDRHLSPRPPSTESQPLVVLDTPGSLV